MSLQSVVPEKYLLAQSSQSVICPQYKDFYSLIKILFFQFIVFIQSNTKLLIYYLPKNLGYICLILKCGYTPRDL